eukprot:TRINITY_DN49503_c0_g1_i1.p1 TRINITY_DN49503_c0_g1~~TRINITY_DN49503_c0_g1_i1.p1  ORF type:complete len:303 (+),score=59.01 TRINITY_DN49503_c0_g1_i1:63-911(+)
MAAMKSLATIARSRLSVGARRRCLARAPQPIFSARWLSAGGAVTPLPCRLVIFDKDGTLLDDNATWAPLIEEGGEALAGTVSGGKERIYELLGYDVKRKTFIPDSSFMTATNWEIYEHFKEQESPEAAAAYTAWLDSIDISRMQGVPVVPLPDLFGPLRDAGIQTAVLTSDDRRFTEKFLHDEKAFDMVGTIVCGNDGLEPKPSAQPVLEICQRLGVEPAAAVMVGDSGRDIGCGLNAKLGSAIGVETGTYTKNLLMDAGAHAVVPTVGQVLAAVQQRHGVE